MKSRAGAAAAAASASSACPEANGGATNQGEAVNHKFPALKWSLRAISRPGRPLIANPFGLAAARPPQRLFSPQKMTTERGCGLIIPFP